MHAIQIERFGNPADVLKVVEVEEPAAPGPNEVLVTVEFSPLNKHDLLLVSGALVQPPLPLIPGNEGVGRILAVGTEVVDLKAGDLVVLPMFAGAWREQVVVPAKGLFALPDGDVEQYSMLGGNPPTAGLILSHYTTLQPGDWVVQNAANSGVGRSLIALAKQRGLRSINLVRNAATISDLTTAGADIVFVDGPAAVGDIQAVIGDAPVLLAVDSVGGPSVGRLIELLTAGGSLVTYASATGEPMWVDALPVIGKHLTVHGFFAGDFDYQEQVVPVIGEAAPLVASGALTVPVAATYALEDIGQALAHLDRGGKILLKVSR